MNKRPKSREETPKEGSDSARRYRTAPICGRAAQNARPFDSFSVQKVRKFGSGAKKSQLYFVILFQSVDRIPRSKTGFSEQSRALISPIRDPNPSPQIYHCAS
jgi:hypothetical protein